MEINYEITEEECIEARKILANSRSKVYINIAKWIVLLYLVIDNILYEQSILNKIINIIWPMVLFFIMEFFISKVGKIFDKKTASKNIGTVLKFGKQRLVILDEEIRYSSDLEEYTFYKDKDWITIYNIHKYLYIVITNETSNVIVVPKDKVPGESIDAILKLGKVKSFGKNPSWNLSRWIFLISCYRKKFSYNK